MNRITTNVDQKLVRDTRFPPEFSQKVDTSKINIQIIKNWAKGEVARILNNEDDIVEGLLFGLIETKNPDIKSLQIQLTGFLGKDAAPFCKELWNLLLDAQKSTTGVPQQLLQAKVNELQQQKVERAQAAEAAQRRRDEDRARDRELEELRRGERNDRNRGRGGGYRDGHDNDRRGGYRGGRDYDRGPRRDYSRSPSPRYRRGSDDYRRRPAPQRETDSYVPSGSNRRRGDGRDDRRYRSPSPNRRNSRRSPGPERDEDRRRDNSPYSRRRSPPRKRRRDVSSSPPRQQRRNHQRSRSSSSSRPTRRDVQGGDDKLSSRRRRSPSSPEVYDARANALKDRRSHQVQSPDSAKGPSDRPRRSSTSLPHKASTVDKASLGSKQQEPLPSTAPKSSAEETRAHAGDESGGASGEVGTDS